MTDDFIWIVTDTTPAGGRGDNNPRNPFEDKRPTIPSGDRPGVPVPIEKLEKEFADFLDKMGRVLRQAQAKANEIGGMELDEIELSVEVSGEGQLSLLGSGTKVGGKGALTLKFKQPSTPKNS